MADEISQLGAPGAYFTLFWDRDVGTKPLDRARLNDSLAKYCD